MCAYDKYSKMYFFKSTCTRVHSQNLYFKSFDVPVIILKYIRYIGMNSTTALLWGLILPCPLCPMYSYLPIYQAGLEIHFKTFNLMIKSQVLVIIKFIKSFIDEHPLCVCHEEIAYIKRELLGPNDEMKLKQKTSQVQYLAWSVDTPFANI